MSHKPLVTYIEINFLIEVQHIVEHIIILVFAAVGRTGQGCQGKSLIHNRCNVFNNKTCCHFISPIRTAHLF